VPFISLLSCGVSDPLPLIRAPIPQPHHRASKPWPARCLTPAARPARWTRPPPTGTRRRRHHSHSTSSTAPSGPRPPPGSFRSQLWVIPSRHRLPGSSTTRRHLRRRTRCTRLRSSSPTRRPRRTTLTAIRPCKVYYDYTSYVLLCYWSFLYDWSTGGVIL
jgi:hypothetical protein